MLPTKQGSIRLFRWAGIDVFLHWSWFIVAVIEIQSRARSYSSFSWNVLEYLSLFLIVLLHEFGHALACRQVGGKADRIVLWPLGGVAYVAPPQRPGATLWSIAAGPLVNVVLAPVLTVLLLLSSRAGWPDALPNAYGLLRTVWMINLGLLIFNLLPIYPLDGGQILRSLLWFFLGRARSLMVTTVIGFIGVAGLIAFAAWARSIWIGILAVFILSNCWRGLMEARTLARIDRIPHRDGWACPECKQSPLEGAFWKCASCSQPFDIFATRACCPYCGGQYPVAFCPHCGSAHPLDEWKTDSAPPGYRK
ncbi:MAG: site-2 protease family protein [Candidatus Omnitrophica bacterium]|nr:site-2 protease family protein [Candidatus Omnitrophota bacterium]